MLLILLFFISPYMFDHDVAMANFQINQGEETLGLQIKIDKEDLDHYYFKKHGKTNDLSKSKTFIQQYLDDNFYLVVNKQKIIFNLQEISKDHYFYHMEFTSPNKVKEVIRHIQLKNTCLIGEVENHSNIVNFQLNGNLRSFRMHEKRVRIEVKY